MDELDKDTIEILAWRIRERFPEARVWAFGSRAWGHSTGESDLDVCVVLDSLDERVDDEIMHIAWQVGLDRDIVISTLTYSSEEFERGPCSASPIVRSIQERGLAA